jgi:hypothetical protein
MADLLATPTDLATALQEDIDTATATMLLELATARVQRAAGGQRIVDVTDTAIIDVTDPYDEYLTLPQLPVRSVSSVLLDGVAITDWYLRQQKLWRSSGWMACWSPPSQVTVTYAHGLLTGSQYLQSARDVTLALAGAGYGDPTAGTVSAEALDDYRVEYAAADARMHVTDSMRDRLRDAYGTSAYTTTSRR